MRRNQKSLQPAIPVFVLAMAVLLASNPTPLAAQEVPVVKHAAAGRREHLSTPYVRAQRELDAGEYLTTIGGCNDCHTTGWAESNGKTPAAERFTGSNIGFRGPWGTTYAANLRLMTQRESEDEWVHVLTTADGGKGKPPMPWMNTAVTSDRDLRAMYRYIKSLGPNPAGVPRNLKPGVEPTSPYIWVTPRTGK